jgi:hypothetical protein
MCCSDAIVALQGWSIQWLLKQARPKEHKTSLLQTFQKKEIEPQKFTGMLCLWKKKKQTEETSDCMNIFLEYDLYTDCAPTQ